MDRDARRLARIAALFDEVVDLEAGARRARLDEACGDDAALRAEVERLVEIDAAAAGGRMVEEAVRSAAEELVGVEDRSGAWAGPYRLVHMLGRGGMGSVYLAERADSEYRARVAVKLVPAGRPSVDVVRRFRTERQILASLEHPNIARLLDGGSLDDGTPYLVMEYVDGVPLTRYCEDTRADLRQRLDLFLAVCDAVSYAHRRLVVHRDLKPGNILVTADGVPKLLDFGIAKLLDPDVAEDLTATLGAPLLTPAYASPEQVRGGPITTATDVYALGLLLYELLTRRKAHRFASGSASTPADVQRVITTTPPVRPSDVVLEESHGPEERNLLPPARLRRALRGDLDTIVMMALRKEPERRYSSVEHLAGDIRAHLNDQPVSARPDSWGYRAGRFLRRHGLAVGSAAAAAAVLVAFSVVTQLQSRRIARERETALQVSSFLVNVFQAADPWAGPDPDVSAREIVARGAARVEAELGDEPEVQATLLQTLGSIYQELAITDSALALTDRAIEIRRSLGETTPELAEAIQLRGRLLVDDGRVDEAVAADREALAMRRRLLGEDHPDVAASLEELGSTLYTAGEHEEGLRDLRDAVARFKRTAGDDDARTLQAQVTLAGAVHFQGRDDEADSLLRAALAGQRRTLGPDHPTIFQTLQTLGVVLDFRDEADSAAAFLREAIAMGTRHLGRDHPDVLTAVGNLAALFARVGPVERADSIYRDLIARKRAADLDFGIQAMTYAQLLVKMGRADEAESLLLAGIRDRDARVARRGGTFVYLFNRLGQVRAARGDVEGSAAAYRDALAVADTVYGPESTRSATMARRLGLAMEKLGRTGEADSLLARALEIRTRALPPDDPDRVASLLDVARVRQRDGRFAEAEAELLQALAGLERSNPPDTAQVADVERRLAGLYTEWGRPRGVRRYRAEATDTAPDTARGSGGARDTD